MTDMSQVITPKSDQISADDLIAGNMVITVADVRVQSGQDQPVSIVFEGSQRVYRPCKSMCRVLVAAWGPDAKNYIGRSMKLYRDPDVQWGGMKVGGIRISEMTHMDGGRPMTMALTEKRGARKPYVVKPLIIQQRKTDSTPSPEAMQDAARAAARRGTEAFRAWWNSDEGKAARPAATLIMDELRSLCAEADAAMAQDHFGLPPVDDDMPTEEQRAAAAAAAMAAIKAQDDAQ